MRKILILAANPKGTSQLRLDEEMREVDEGLKRSQHRDEFELVQKLAVRPRDIQRAMLDVEPQIIHFSGHSAEEEGLIFEDELGRPKFVTGEALARLFELFADQIECVVLNNCYSESQAEAIAQHIPYVIGMKQAIGNKAAITFAVGFYDALGAGRPLEFAYKFGCSAISLEGIAEHLTPVLLKKAVGPEAVSLSGASSQPANPEPPVGSSNQAIEVFFSYAHEDEQLRDKLAKQLKILERQGVIAAWYDRDISAGAEWANQIDQHLETAKVILLLVSDDFVASDYCYDTEMKRAMERHSTGEARVIPVILRRVDNWQSAPFGRLKALPKDAKPVTSWDNLDEAFADVARGIRKVVEQLKKN